ncbi:hypothetical protein HYPSUDRAFT_38053 [Hypholoma sublateritium FD-334 SS-4]|uniref:G-protein coupled receptors family 1 profile domain-containing protein n=1 Tax=Hypholoma sublateritium (strain FD-334 SS-4) TaxID=945553 RepID=A0A0D2MMC2_HYPSF|nr:hypothetical protein HYPSUDRAFT_38053 [Hypholoma sublateritium FD-334 SS-4]
MSKLTWMKFMYLLTRYSAIAEAGVVIALLTIPGDWYAECSLVFKTNVALFVFGLGAGEVIMTIRTWAVWQKNRTMMYILPIFYVVIWTGAFVAMGIFLTRLEFAPDPRNAYIGCYATGTSPIIFVPWVLLLFYDAVMFCLMAIPTYKLYRSGSSSRFIRIVHRDGVVYYLYLFVLSLANIIITLTFPSDLILVFSLMSRIIHAVLACRVVLHIDQHGRQAMTASESSLPPNTPIVSSRPRGKSLTQAPLSPHYWETVTPYAG